LSFAFDGVFAAVEAEAVCEALGLLGCPGQFDTLETAFAPLPVLLSIFAAIEADLCVEIFVSSRFVVGLLSFQTNFAVVFAGEWSFATVAANTVAEPLCDAEFLSFLLGFSRYRSS